MSEKSKLENAHGCVASYENLTMRDEIAYLRCN